MNNKRDKGEKNARKEKKRGKVEKLVVSGIYQSKSDATSMRGEEARGEISKLMPTCPVCKREVYRLVEHHWYERIPVFFEAAWLDSDMKGGPYSREAFESLYQKKTKCICDTCNRVLPRLIVPIAVRTADGDSFGTFLPPWKEQVKKLREFFKENSVELIEKAIVDEFAEMDAARRRVSAWLKVHPDFTYSRMQELSFSVLRVVGPLTEEEARLRYGLTNEDPSIRDFCIYHRQKEYHKQYNQRPEVKEKHKKQHKQYNQRPEVKKQHKQYNQRPEVKEKRREYRQRSEVKEKRREYHKQRYKRSEVKERLKRYRLRPEVKERLKLYYRRPEVKERQKKRYEEAVACRRDLKELKQNDPVKYEEICKQAKVLVGSKDGK